MISHSLSWFELSHGWLAIYSFCCCSWPGHNTISLYCTGIKPETVRTLCSESSACISHALLFICAKIQVKYVHLWVYNMCLSLYELYNPWTAIKRQSPYCRSLTRVLAVISGVRHLIMGWTMYYTHWCVLYFQNEAPRSKMEDYGTMGGHTLLPSRPRFYWCI